MKTREDYKDYYLEQLIENYGDMTERDYNSAKKFCYDEEWNLGEVGNMAEAIDGLGDAWTEYQKQYKEGFEIMNNWNIKPIDSSLEPDWTVYEPNFKNLKPRHESDPENGWGMMTDEKDSLIGENGGKVTVEYGHGGSCTLYGAETGDVISTFTTIKEMQDFKKNHNLTIVKNSRRNNMKKTIKSDIDWESAKHAFDDKKYLIYKTGIDDEWKDAWLDEDDSKIVGSSKKGDKNMKIQSKRAIKSGRFIKSGAGAGYDVTIEGIELDTQNYKVISDEIANEEYNEHNTLVEVPVKPCIVEWEAEDYYYRVSSKDGIEIDGIPVMEYFDNDKQVDGGKAILKLVWYQTDSNEFNHQSEFTDIETACNYCIPNSISIKSSFSAGWIHSDLPVEQIHFEDEYHGYSLDIGEVYYYETMSVDLVAPNISENINWFFAHDHELEKIFFDDEEDYDNEEDYEDDEIESSRKPVTSGLTFRQAVQDFKAAGQWNDYYEMQQDWEAYKDGLERDGVISEKTRSTWGNPCTPEGFKKWNK